MNDGLKNRVIGCLVVRNGIVVQSIGFREYLPVGKPKIAVEYLNVWGIDEIVLLDISPDRAKRGPIPSMIAEVSPFCFVPLTVGGGIRNVEDIGELIHSGADKVSINTAAVRSPEIIEKGADIFGDQCIVVSIDVKRTGREYEIFLDSGRTPTGKNPVEFARLAEKMGAGEIFLNSIDRDGSKNGFDTELISRVSEAVGIPVIACGGAGRPEHLHEAIASGASAVAAANFFHFTEQSVVTTKSWLDRKGVPVRLDTYAHYRDSEYLPNGRVGKKSDEALENLLFKHYPKEVI